MRVPAGQADLLQRMEEEFLILEKVDGPPPSEAALAFYMGVFERQNYGESSRIAGL